MTPFELFNESGRTAGIWACGVCRRVATSEDHAEECCKCSICGQVMEDRTKEYTASHRTCWNERQCKRQVELLEEATLVDGYDGPVFWNENYYQDIDEAADTIADVFYDRDGDPIDWPAYLHCCHVKQFAKLDHDRIIEQICEDEFEDAYDHLDDDSVEAFRLACEAFNAANTRCVSWSADYSRKVAFPSWESLGLELKKEPTE